MNTFKTIMCMGLIFSPIAAVMAFVISYEEYLHHYADKRMPFKIAMNHAIVTLLIFILLSLVAGIIFSSV